jgi:hypothetical protein
MSGKHGSEGAPARRRAGATRLSRCRIGVGVPQSAGSGYGDEFNGDPLGGDLQAAAGGLGEHGVTQPLAGRSIGPPAIYRPRR